MKFNEQRKFRFSYEDGFKGFSSDEAWRYMEIRGRYGMVYPYNERELGLQVKANHYSRIRLARKIPGSIQIQNADDLIVFRVSDEAFVTAGKIIGAHKKRILTPEQREKAVARLNLFRPTRPRKHSTGPGTGENSRNGERGPGIEKGQ
jgi:hypothetical protein